MECVQEDRNNPLPCTPEDKSKWLRNGKDVVRPGDDAPSQEERHTDPNEMTEEELLEELMGVGDGEDDDEALLEEFMGDGDSDGDEKKPEEAAEPESIDGGI
jgi:hypothetical protein